MSTIAHALGPVDAVELQTVSDARPRQSSHAELRGSARVESRCDIELEVSAESDSNFYLGFTENLSEGGLFVSTYMLKPIGTVLDLRVQLAGNDEAIHLRGEVRWVRTASSGGSPGMGIRFESTTAAHEARIGHFLKTRDPLFYEE